MKYTRNDERFAQHEAQRENYIFEKQNNNNNNNKIIFLLFFSPPLFSPIIRLYLFHVTHDDMILTLLLLIFLLKEKKMIPVNTCNKDVQRTACTLSEYRFDTQPMLFDLSIYESVRRIACHVLIRARETFDNIAIYGSWVFVYGIEWSTSSRIVDAQFARCFIVNFSTLRG